MNLARQLERSAQIPLATLIAIGLEVQITRDQCERLACKSLQLEGEHEVTADLVIGYDLDMAQNQPKLTADWFAHRMGATLTPAAAASKKRAMQELKDQRALGGKEAYQSIATWQQTAPHLRGTAPLTNPAGAAGQRTASLRTQAGAGERTSPLPLPPASNPGTTHHPLEAAEPYTPSGREYAAPCPGPVRVLYTCVPHPHAQMNTHVRSHVHDHGTKPAQTYGGLVYAQNEHHAHIASKKKNKQKTGHAGRTNALWVERTRTSQFLHGNRPPPHPRGTTPFTNPDGVGDRCTNAGKTTNHPFTACPPTTCHKCGQPGHIQRHCPN